MPTPQEPDFPPGHPARFDYDPKSDAAKEWARKNIFPKGERDFPPDHPKAVDTPGNKNHLEVLPGIDPDRPDHEAFTGRSPEQAKAAKELYRQLAEGAKETPPAQPVMAPAKVPDTSKQRAMKIEGQDAYMILCPGCKHGHKFDSRWKFNGSLELPTFTPSYLENADDQQLRCHCYVTNGQIQFLPDSGHALRGATVELPSVAEQQETINA
jgi:hypothetical protein